MKLVLGEFGALRAARKAREAIAAELGATLDPISDVYSYSKGGQVRRLVSL